MIKETPVLPEQVNEHGQITDEKLLKKNRLLMGLGYILNNSEENSLGAIPTKIITALGGDDRHLGIYGTAPGLGGMAQFLGAYLLRWQQSDRKAMLWIMRIAASIAALIAAVLLLGRSAWFHSAALPFFLVLMILFFAVIGVQLNIESTWIGDLVPRERRGGFNSFKWMMSVAGMFVFVFIMARIVDAYPHHGGFASIFIMFCVSFVLARQFIYTRVTDRTPKSANYFSSGATGHDRLNYRSLPFWCYVGYLVCWAAGRGMFFTFTNAYLLQVVGLKLTSIAWLQMAGFATSVVALFGFGKIIDKVGSRLPLLWITGVVSFSMLLFPAATYWGVKAVLVHNIIGGFAGYTHAMLLINYGLEIFPDKGRAGYIGLSRVFGGVVGILSPLLGGGIAYLLRNFHADLWGRDICRYHVVFILSAAIVSCAMIPLLLVGRRTVKEA
jgi:hypothetical protein